MQSAQGEYYGKVQGGWQEHFEGDQYPQKNQGKNRTRRQKTVGCIFPVAGRHEGGKDADQNRTDNNGWLQYRPQDVAIKDHVVLQLKCKR